MSGRALLLAAALMAVLLGALVIGYRALNEPMNLPDAGYTLDVPSGARLRNLSDKLAARGILSYPVILTAYGRLTGQASDIKAGEYEVAAGTTPLDLLRQLVEGRVKLHSFTIVEGWTTTDLIRAMRKNPYLRSTLAAPAADAIAAVIELEDDRPEGWFFPDTYRFPRGTTDREILRRAHARMQLILDQAWSGKAPGLPLKNPYQALILASIVEKETARDAERTRIAGVLIRRLEAGMKLQADPTVIYGLGADFTGDLTRRQMLRDSPYNTYTRTGLPPTPISLPGESSILAAVHPDDSRFLYFVASPLRDGSHVFSETLREHNVAVKRYLDAMREAGK